MEHQLRYILYLNVSLIEAQEAYQKARKGHNLALTRSALSKLLMKQDALKSYCRALIRQGVSPMKTDVPEMF